MNIIIGLLIGGLVVLSVLLGLSIRTNKTIKQDIKAEYEALIASGRAEAIKSSKAILKGQISEQIMPLFPDFPYPLQNLKFLSQPIDYIVFNGAQAVHDGVKDAKIDIIFADVKTGHARLTKVQAAIKKAVHEGRIRFESWRIDEDNKLKIKEE